MWNVKYDTNEPIYKTETDSWIQRINLWLPRAMEGGDGWTGCLGLADPNCYIWKTTRSYLSTGNHIQSPGINHNGKDIKNVCICITESLYSRN